MYSAVLELKNMRLMSLPHTVMSCHAKWPTQARINDPRAAVNQLPFFNFDVFDFSRIYCVVRVNISLIIFCNIFKNPIYLLRA